MYLPNNSELYNAQANAAPTTLDYLRPASFKFEISSLPRASFMCQVASIPRMSIGSATQIAPKRDLPVIGDKIVFDNLTIEFIIAEDMSNYIEIYNWISEIDQLGLNSTIDDYRKAITNFGTPINNSGADRNLYSDANLFIIDSTNNAVAKINFKDLIPLSLESIPFDLKNTSQEPITASATFAYSMFNIEKV